MRETLGQHGLSLRVRHNVGVSVAPPRATTARVAMLLDNHYRPDPRVAFEIDLLRTGDVGTRVIAWDRRPTADALAPTAAQSGKVRLYVWRGRGEALARDFRVAGTEAEVVRIPVAAPGNNPPQSLRALVRFGFIVWRNRHVLTRGCSALVVHDVYLLPLGWLLARTLRLPFVYDAHEDYQLMEARRLPHSLVRLVTAIENLLARDAFAIVVPGRPRLPRWRRVTARPLVLLPNFCGREQAPAEAQEPSWDIVCAGTLSGSRRMDILVELARQRPELRIGVAGRGSKVDEVAAAAKELSNFDFIGWCENADEVLARGRTIYYGRDPEDPYSEVACPNTLYQALRHRKPLIFFCGGEAADLAAEFRIGIRSEASVEAVSAAYDAAVATSDWEFEAAWQAVWRRNDLNRYLTAINEAIAVSAAKRSASPARTASTARPE